RLIGKHDRIRTAPADVMLQYERFWLPVLGGPQRNLSGRVELRWEPRLRLFR
ncbi:MAG: hypothetical protein QM757_42110, partial [Paludibaculum sp.]